MFARVLNDNLIATQIAALLNKHNKLGVHYSKDGILLEKDTYIVETVDRFVVAAVQIKRLSYAISEAKHLVVRTNMRKKGLAKSLVTAAVNRSTTPIVIATIREENAGSIKTFESCGFVCSGKYTTNTRDVLLYMTTSPKWRKKVDKNRKLSYPDLTGGERAIR